MEGKSSNGERNFYPGITGKKSENMKKATFGAGCFWCVEPIFEEVDGVLTVDTGYSGGDIENPTYEQVCSGKTEHAEVVQLTYDPERVSYEKLLKVFWSLHDPTQVDRQGADVGRQYRSVIFYHDQEQKDLAESYKAELDASGAWGSPIMTEIAPFKGFYKAEENHQDFYRRNPQSAYCQMVIVPKLEKFREVFGEKV